MAIGMLDHTAGIAVACHAAPVVIHPGFLLGRAPERAIDAVVAQLAELRARLTAKGRAGPFGVEVMGRVNELGSLDHVLAICGCLEWTRPVLDFAHMHATSDGGFVSTETFTAALAGADAVLAPGVPFHIHFSDISFANRNEKSHVRHGQGTLRVEPLARALLSFTRPATIILESPDEDSNRAITAALRQGHPEGPNGPSFPGRLASGPAGRGRPPARASGRGGLHPCREAPGRPEWLWPPVQGWAGAIRVVPPP